MERFSDLLLMLAGTAIGAYALFPGPRGGETNAEKTSFFSVPADKAAPANPVPLKEVRAKYVPASPVVSDEGVRTFSPTSPAFRELVNLDAADAAVLNTDSDSGGWTSVVTTAPVRSHVLRSSKPKDGATRFELARDLQRGLKKAGCYGGAINGRWTTSTKAAMTAFMQRVNATLPVDAPDYVLLSLVEAHDTTVCSAACPSGQARGKSGQCIPQAIVAQAEKNSKQQAHRRIALPATSRQKTKQRQAVAAAEPEKLPWLENEEAQTAAARDVTRSAPYPGRMSIGGPVTGNTPSGNAVSNRTHPVPLDSADDGDPTLSVAELPPDGATPAGEADAESVEATRGTGWKRPKHRHHRVSVSRSKRYYRSPHRRRGDPRPGTARYNVARVLGGIY